MNTKIILIDLENVQPTDLACLRGRPFQTKVFCGANQAKIPFELATQLQPLIKAQLNAHATETAANEVIVRLKQGGMSMLPDGKLTFPPTQATSIT